MAISQAKPLGILDTLLLAEYIIARCNNVSHLKIQKLLYYVQGYHLGFFGEPIIHDEFEAWIHGPVSRSFYNIMKKQFGIEFTMYSELHSSEDVKDLEDKIKAQITADQFDVIDDVLNMLGNMSGTDLELCTHAEKDTWQKARGGCAPADYCSNIIQREDMIHHFKHLIVA